MRMLAASLPITSPSSKALRSVIEMAELDDADTAAMKSLPVAVKVRAPVPASQVDWPVMTSAPVCVMPPWVLVALKTPPTVLLPRLSASVLDSVRLPALLTCPRVSELPVVIDTTPPLADTGPVNRLSAWPKSILPRSAVKELLPAISMASDCAMSPPLLARLSAPPTVLRPSVMVPVLVRDRAPLVVIAPTTRALSSVMLTELPSAVSEALKSLPARSDPETPVWMPAKFRLMLPVPASRLAAPVTASAPLWLIGPLPLTTVRTPPTALVPKFSAPAVVRVRLPPTWIWTSTRPSVSRR